MSDAALKELQRIPGVGPSIARDLLALGFTRVADLHGRDPEKLYARSNKLCGQVQDRCLLYVFRCAVYFAEEAKPHHERLKWWNWTDEKMGMKRKARPRALQTR
jgi:hypothetical protein